MFGCPERAKSSPDLTHWPDAVALGVRLVTRAHVVSIETDARGLATGVVYVGRMAASTDSARRS